MLEGLVNIFYNSILLPIKEGFKVFIWSNDFYFTFFVIFLLSIPITAMRCYQVLNKNKTISYPFFEILVWLFRLLQYSLIVLIGNDIQVGNLFSENEWNYIFHGLIHINLQEMIGDLVGYCILFGIYNLVIYTVIREKWLSHIFNKVIHYEANLESIRLVIILGVKNLFLIPVSVIYLLSILTII